MKKIVIATLAMILVVGHFSFAHAEYVSGYYRKNGTYVQGYERSDPDSSPYNNYDYPGNYNPNTGEDTPGNDETYLNNYYKNSSSSDDSLYEDTTPSCPDNSYESGDQCKCDAGYINQSGSCVDADSYCDDNHGYESTYDSLSDSCTCNTGYGMNSSGQCVDENQSCENQIGYNSSYDSSDNTCTCDDGYILNSDQNKCVSKDDYCQDKYGLDSSYNYSTDRCVCNDGYTYQNDQCKEVEDDTPDITPIVPLYIAPTPKPVISSNNLTASVIAISPNSTIKSLNVPLAPSGDNFLNTITQSPVSASKSVSTPVKNHHWYNGISNFFKKLF